MVGLTHIVPHFLDRARNLVLPQFETTKMLTLKCVRFQSGVRDGGKAVWPETCRADSRCDGGHNAPRIIKIDQGLTELQHFLWRGNVASAQAKKSVVSPHQALKTHLLDFGGLLVLADGAAHTHFGRCVEVVYTYTGAIDQHLRFLIFGLVRRNDTLRKNRN